MFRSDRNLIDRLERRLAGGEPRWVRTAASTVTMLAAVSAAGLAVWKFLRENPDLLRRGNRPHAPDVPPPFGGDAG